MLPANQDRSRLGPPQLIGLFFATAGAVTFLAGVSLWNAPSVLDFIWRIKPDEYALLLRIGRPAAIGFLALSAVLALASRGAFMRKRWGWWLTFAIFLVHGAADAARVVSSADPGSWIGIGMVTVILVWLTRPQVRSLFGR